MSFQALLLRRSRALIILLSVSPLFSDGKTISRPEQTTPSGQTIWLRTSKVALRDRDHAVFGWLGIL